MSRLARFLCTVAACAVLAGCGDSTPTAVPTDRDSVEQLKKLQKQGQQGEK